HPRRRQDSGHEPVECAGRGDTRADGGLLPPRAGRRGASRCAPQRAAGPAAEKSGPILLGRLRLSGRSWTSARLLTHAGTSHTDPFVNSPLMAPPAVLLA